MKLTQPDAVKLMQELLWTAQKIRSNATEALSGHQQPTAVEQSVLQFLMPSLFSDDSMNLVRVLMTYANKANHDDRVDPIDLFNALTLCWREPAFEMIFTVYGPEPYHKSGLPQPIDAMKALMTYDREVAK